MRTRYNRFGMGLAPIAKLLRALLVASVGLGLLGAAAVAAGKKAKADPAADTPIEQGAKKFEELDLKEFDRSENIDNPWLPLKPGMQWVFEGYTEEEGKRIPHRLVFSVTDLVKKIGGVRSRVIFDADYSNGVLVEKELTFFAQDKGGNVWHLGQYVEVHEEGGFVGGQIWHFGNPDGAKAGIVMPANPQPGTPSFSQGYAPAPYNWTDRGRVHKMGQKIKVPAGSYEDVLIMDEFDASNPGVFQLKYYARGVGNVAVGHRGKKGDSAEVLNLVKVHQLSPDELAKTRALALELEKRGSMYPPSPIEHVPLAKTP
ncbi:hypothetical protein [Rhodoferax ferrireducens]|uniref:hypothetical protein n=1 Tax=Rhodoferax ferrireducens TaxID=192843 RepID=UPI0013009DC4|nr:hypothetical protein [Rhodoferax ferrireducens]